MNSQQLLFINGIIFLALVLFFVFGRTKPRQPTQLDLKASRKEADPAVFNEKIENERVLEAKDVSQSVQANRLIQGDAVFFVYNGHEWEAHEVLGLPKGCTIQVATSHYQKLIKTSDPSTFEFFDSAYSAILKSK